MLTDRTTVAATLRVLLEVIPEDPGRIDTPRLVQALSARGFERTPRSVQRQLHEAMHLYPIRCLAKSKPFQYSWERGKKQGFTGADPNAALALWLVFDHLTRLLPPETVDLLRRQQASLDQALARSRAPLATWRDRVRVVSTAPTRLAAAIAPEVVRVVYDALLAGKRVEVDYRKRGAKTARTHELHPLGVVVKGATVMLVCRFEGKDGPATVQLHRITRARALPTAAVPPAGFDLDAFLAAGGASFVLGEPVDLELRVAAGAAPSFEEAPLSDGQTLTDDGDGWWRLRARTTDTVDLRGLLASYGDALEVVSPAALRAYFQEQAENLIRLYGRPSQRPPAPPGDLRVRAAKARERARR
jgi:predicted DNA-binding transcriptional regulator YafY